MERPTPKIPTWQGGEDRPRARLACQALRDPALWSLVGPGHSSAPSTLRSLSKLTSSRVPVSRQAHSVSLK